MSSLMQDGALAETGNGVVVWMSQGLMQTCMDEAVRSFPLETGGTFMGVWAGSTTAVITAVIGPGPEASYGRHQF